MARAGFFGWGTGIKSQVSAAVKQKEKQKPAQLQPFNVILMNDEEHTYEYVIEMLRAVFGYAEQRGYALAKLVDQDGRAIILTTHKELAELKREQIGGYGADLRISSCRGSMSALIEPA
jgi:ATP-dependent Clp protease adaptor protein ClpS